MCRDQLRWWVPPRYISSVALGCMEVNDSTALDFSAESIMKMFVIVLATANNDLQIFFDFI